MKFQPRKPNVKIEDFRDQDEMAYDLLMYVVRDHALKMYKNDPEVYSMGLEMCIETIIGLLDKGLLKLIHIEGETEDDDGLRIGAFDPETGEYV